MAARLIPRGDSASATPLRWPTIQSGALLRQGPTANSGQAGADGHEALQCRISELERELANRGREAYREGEAAGAQQTAARLQPVIERFAQTITELAGCRARLRREAEQDLVRLSLAIARRILHRELTVDPEALGGIVKAALDRLDARDVSRVRVHPADAPIIEEQLRRGGFGMAAEIVADSGLERGAAIFETSRGQFDASVETQLQEIERGFTDVSLEP
jgi:flagellar assembly protein FliH